MIDISMSIGSQVSMRKTELDHLLTVLRTSGFTTVGPSSKDGSIVYEEINGLADLPRGFQSEQEPASYRLFQSGKDRYFDFIPGSHSWKQYLFPPRQALFSAKKESTWNFKPVEGLNPRFALIGVRACELAAILIQDRIFLREDYKDPIYRSRREGLFVLAVNCLEPDATCFCTSMGTGPQHGTGFDLCMTELDDHFIVKVGSELGRSILAEIDLELPSAFMQNLAKQAMEKAQDSITRRLDTADLPDLLTGSLDADRWSEVGKRCLSCASCTLVCPTCFCWDATDSVDVLGKYTQRERVWDSCFNPMYSYVVGGNTRPNIRSRYRQWLTHKLGTWKEQFGMLGCVGCGRCITWCPAGIDLTEEVAAIREESKR